jgi:hypothetical protein
MKSHTTHSTIFIIFIDGCSSTQFDCINKHTVSLWLYDSPRRSRDAVTCPPPSVSCLQTVQVQGCLFHSATGVHCRTLPGVWFLLSLSEWVQGYIYRFSRAKQTDSIWSGDTGTVHRVASDMRKGECIAGRGGHLQHWSLNKLSNSGNYSCSFNDAFHWTV